MNAVACNPASPRLVCLLWPFTKSPCYPGTRSPSQAKAPEVLCELFQDPRGDGIQLEYGASRSSMGIYRSGWGFGCYKESKVKEIDYIVLRDPVIGRKMYLGVIDRRALKRRCKRARDAIAWAKAVDERCQRMNKDGPKSD